MAITKFGEFMRIFRIKNKILMKDTADALNVKTPFLSAVENGKKKIPGDWYEKISKAYNMNEEEKENLRIAIEESANQIRIDLENCNEMQKNLVFQFQRSFENLDEETSKKIIEILKGE
jgi:HTH-type transcriptional regulator, competence development regulator